MNDKYKFKGTQGEWYYQEESDAYTHIVRANLPQHSTFFICQLSQNTTGISEANARLIAAAPDLLNACVEMISLLETMENEDDIQIYDDDKEVIDRTRKAIHKAPNL